MSCRLFGNRAALSTPVPKTNFSLDDTFCRETAHGWLWNMRILLRSLQTGSYFQTVANWTDDANVAFDFEQVEQAQKAALETGLAQAEVVLWYDSPPCQLRLPIVQPAEISEAALTKCGMGQMV
jgi:hypothetical protein